MTLKTTFKVASLILGLIFLSGCRVNPPSPTEEKVASETKQVVIGGKDWNNPIPDSPESVKEGAEHFQHHCQLCHGLDGQNTGVPFADKMSPPVANLNSKDVQAYSNGQLKWIIQNGIRFSGMPAWNGTLEDDEMWNIVNYLRHLPAAGSLGAPQIFKETESEHEAAGKSEGHHHH